jgi:anti-sigma regulatory factor (Ser/Thr protein kinase)
VTGFRLNGGVVVAVRLPGGAPEIAPEPPLLVHEFGASAADIQEARGHLGQVLADLDVEPACRSAAAVITADLCENAAIHGGTRGRIELRMASPYVVVDVVDDGAWAGQAGHEFGGDDVPAKGRGLTRALELCDDVRITSLVGETRVRCALRDRGHEGRPGTTGAGARW